MSRFLALTLGAAFLTSSLFAQSGAPTPEVKEEVIKRVKKVVETNAFVPNIDFKKWDEYLAVNKTKIDSAKTDDEFATAINETFSKFGLSHIVLSTPKAAEARATGKVIGIGIQASPTEEGTLILRVVPGAPADEAGIKAGDIIVKVDGVKAEGNKGIAGAAGTKVTVTVKHPNGTFDDYQLTRRAFSSIRKEELSWVNADTAKLNVWSFLDYDRDAVEGFYEKAKNSKNLILDLRFNGGGAVASLMHLGGLFLDPKVPMGHMINRPAYDEFVRLNGREPKNLNEVAKASGMPIKPRNLDFPRYKGNLVVLINGASGSASEILAAALKEQANATVIGTKSAGAVLVSLISPATNGYTIQYPVSDYITANGLRLEGAGVKPDFEIKETKVRMDTDPDPAVDKALTVFKVLADQQKRAKAPAKASAGKSSKKSSGGN